MATLAGTLITPNPDAVIEGTINIVAPAQRDVGGVTLVRIAHEIPVANSAYSKEGVPGGEYDVLERLEDGDGMHATEQVYRILVPEGEGTYSIRGLRDIYSGPPPEPSAIASLIAFLQADAAATYAPQVHTAVLTRDGEGRITSAVENGVTVTYTRDSEGRIQSETKGGKTTTYTRDSAGRVESWSTV